MENQGSSVNTKVPFDVTEITTDDINMKDIVITFTQSSDKTEKMIGINKSQIITLALNLLSTNSFIRRIYYSHLWLSLSPKVSRRVSLERSKNKRQANMSELGL
ncbi:6679_t:CDS:1 [Funneliformis mosseae]|uniref:6679_t:CDS:1 n=1 Tax=Funneliformis mosseae TaxID=27381 RepID=A0A9N9GB66_FUNMO|nr:6679_t:CDS:1 [Funneliformis mosseae]